MCFQLANSRAKRIMANQSIIALLVYLYYESLTESRVSFIHVRYNETGFYKRDLPRPVLASKQQPQHGIIKSTFFTFFFYNDRWNSKGKRVRRKAKLPPRQALHFNFSIVIHCMSLPKRRWSQMAQNLFVHMRRHDALHFHEVSILLYNPIQST